MKKSPLKRHKPSEESAQKGKSEISVSRFFEDCAEPLKLRWLAGKNGGGRLIHEASIHRPGLALAGFFDYFADKRIQVIGGAENAFLKHLSAEKRLDSIVKYISQPVPCIIFTRNIVPDPAFIEICDRISLPIMVSSMVTYNIINGIILYLDKALAPCIKVIGNLVDVHGTGVLIRGASGIGKSECALALLRRGSALVADDVVKIKRTSNSEIFGEAAIDEMIGFLEIRGLGLINIIQMFGISSFRHHQQVHLVATLKTWNSLEKIERTGLDSENYRILDISLPHVTVPVAPGRETANVIEVAAQEFRMRKLGIHAGHVLNQAIIKKIAAGRNVRT